MANKRILIIDGDLLVYRNAAAVEKRTIDVTHIKSGRSKEFNTRTEFKKFLADQGRTYDENDYSIVDKQTAQEFAVVAKILRKQVENLRDYAWADEVEIYSGNAEDTFRHNLMLPTPYKDNREGTIKPIHLDKAKGYLKSKLGGHVVAGIEADDVVTIRAYEELAKGNYPIIATIDKDAYQTQGVAILNWLNEPWEIKEIPTVGELEKVKAAIKGSGLKFLAYQVLAGDPTDTYQPYALSKVYYGATTAMKALADATTEKEILEVVIQQYKKLYPVPIEYTSHNGAQMIVDWKFLLQMYWKCAYMKRSWDDKSDVWEFMKARGVNID